MHVGVPKAAYVWPDGAAKRARDKVVTLAGVRDAALLTLRYTSASWAVADGVRVQVWKMN